MINRMKIETRLLPAGDPETYKLALECLNSGGTIAIATDTVYGIAAKINNVAGINKLFEIKMRQRVKAIAVLIADNSQLDAVATKLTPEATLLAKEFWPGGLTLIVDRNPGLPAELSPTNTIGVRMPDHLHTQNLIRTTGPLATTSANVSREPDLTSGIDVYDKFYGKLNLVVDSGQTQGGVPSTVIDCTSYTPAILREGAVSKTDISTIIQIEN